VKRWWKPEEQYPLSTWARWAACRVERKETKDKFRDGSLKPEAIIKTVLPHLKIERFLNEILQILNITLFKNTSLLQALTSIESQKEKEPVCNQLNLFNF